MVSFRIIRNDSGAAAVEMAFVLPVLVLMIWIFAQMATVYRALSGIQMAWAKVLALPPYVRPH